MQAKFQQGHMKGEGGRVAFNQNSAKTKKKGKKATSRRVASKFPWIKRKY